MLVYPRHPIEAQQLTWHNWQEMAERYNAKFVQGLSIEKSTGRVGNGRAYLAIPDPHTDGLLRVDMGMWVVEKYDGGYAILTTNELYQLFVEADDQS